MLQVICRSTIIYLVLLAGIRLLGKRQMGELELNELVIAMLVSDFASTPLQDLSMPLHYGIASALTLLALSLLFSFLCLKSLRFRMIFYGNPTVIINNGKLVQSAMRRNRFTVDELMEELRLQGIVDLSTIKYAILETNGHLSVLLCQSEQPVTAAQMGLSSSGDPGLPVILINDGRLIEHNLKGRGLDLNWLEKQLHSHHIKHHKDVFLLTIDESNHIYLVPKEV